MIRRFTQTIVALAMLGGVSLVGSGSASEANASEFVPDTVQIHAATVFQRMPDASARVLGSGEWHARGSYGVLVDTPFGLAAGVDVETEEHSRPLFRGAGSSSFDRTGVLLRLRYGYRLPIPLEQLEVVPYATVAGGPSFSTLRLTSDGQRFRESATGMDVHAALGTEVRLLLEMVILGAFFDGGLTMRAPLEFRDMTGPEGTENLDAGTLRTGGGTTRLGVILGLRF